MLKKLLFLTMIIGLVTFQSCSEEDEVVASVTDCAGTIGGTAVEDDCGVCGGDNSTCTDCAGVVNGTSTQDCAGTCGGTAVVDDCGDCDGNNAAQDCACECGGSAIEDQCGVCGGNDSTCTDCAGVVNGTSTEDACGVCDGAAASLDDCLANGACSLPENSMYISSTGQLWYNSTEAIGGVQFAIQ